MGEKRTLYRVWVRKPKEIRPTGRPQNRWGNDIKRAKEIG
jgi:hypothetical protein